MSLCTELIYFGKVKEKEVIDQFLYAKKKGFAVVRGLQLERTLAAYILNKAALINHIQGVETPEDADLVHLMSILTSFEIIANNTQIKDLKYRRIEITTRFDGRFTRTFGTQKKAY